MSGHWQPALVTVLAPFVAHKLVPEAVPAPSAVPDWENEQLRPLLARLDAHVRNHAFLAADTLTIADFSVGGIVTYFRAAEFPFAAFPRIAAWYGRLEASQRTAVEPWK